jgi:acyl-CoA thioesterase FadM
MATALRVEFSYELVRVEDAHVLATARTTHVPVNRDGRPCRLPVALREIFS